VINMNTLRLFQSRTQQVHPTAAWYLSDLGEFRGKQELYTRQSPQRLKALREQQAAGAVECKGRGPAAKWRKKG